MPIAVAGDGGRVRRRWPAREDLWALTGLVSTVHESGPDKEDVRSTQIACVSEWFWHLQVFAQI